MTERILTLHPKGKKGVHISKEKYDLTREAIVESLLEHGELTFTELATDITRRLNGRLQGSVNWYTISVQLDLEAKGIVQRVGARPHRLRLVEKSLET